MSFIVAGELIWKFISLHWTSFFPSSNCREAGENWSADVRGIRRASKRTRTVDFILGRACDSVDDCSVVFSGFEFWNVKRCVGCLNRICCWDYPRG